MMNQQMKVAALAVLSIAFASSAFAQMPHSSRMLTTLPGSRALSRDPRG